jgi:hypothetical protein
MRQWRKDVKMIFVEKKLEEWKSLQIKYLLTHVDSGLEIYKKSFLSHFHSHLGQKRQKDLSFLVCKFLG